METLELLDYHLCGNLTPKTLEAQYRKGDSLFIVGLEFQMSYYSLEAIGKDQQQSRYVEYTGNGLTIYLDFFKNTIEII